jgi:hypothetical protein
MSTMQGNLEPDLVTVVIRHQVRLGARTQYLQWLERIIPVAARFPGHHGVNVAKPSGEGDAYTITIRFDALRQAQDWLDSSVRHALMGQALHMLEHAEEVETVTGLELLFTPRAGPSHARRYKQFLLILSVIYPLSLVIPWMLAPLFAMAPVLQLQAVSVLMVSAVVVGLMTYVVMPHYTRLVGNWLFK